MVDQRKYKVQGSTQQMLSAPPVSHGFTCPAFPWEIIRLPQSADDQ